MKARWGIFSLAWFGVIMSALAFFNIPVLAATSSSFLIEPSLATSSTSSPIVDQKLTSVPLALYGFPAAVRLSGTNAQVTLSIPVYPGLVPQSLHLVIQPTPNIREGFITVEHENAAIYSVTLPVSTDGVDVPLAGLTPKNNLLTLTLNGYFSADVETCSAFRSRWADVSGMSVVFRGMPEPPTSLANFFSPTLERLNVYIGSDPSTEMITAALNIASYAKRMTAAKDLEVNVVPAYVTPTTSFKDPSARSILLSSGGDRIIRLVPTAQGWPYLYITAPSGAWQETLTPFLDWRTGDLLQLDMLKVVKAKRATTTVTGAVTFADLGSPLMRLQGVGEMRGAISVPQTAFGRQIQGPVLHLKAAASVLQKDAAARLDTFFNDELVDSYRLGEAGGSFERTVPLKGAVLARDNKIDFVLTYTPPGGDCRVGLHNMVLDIKGDSMIEATSSPLVAPLFDRYPQILLPGFDLVLEDASKETLTAAARALILWQRLSPQPLRPQVAWLDRYVLRGTPAVIIASNPKKLPKFDFFLNPDTFRLKEVGLEEDLVTTRPFAVMQAFVEQETPLLVLSNHGWPSGVGAPLDYLSAREGWYDAKGNISVVTKKGEYGTAELRQLSRLPVQYGFWGDGSSLTSRARTIYLVLGVIVSIAIVVGAALLGFSYRRRQRSQSESRPLSERRAARDR